jgi:hypothetical protein
LADHQVLIAEDEDDLGHMARELKTYSEKAGLKVNVEKVEYLVVGNGKIEDLQLENELMKEVEKFKYTGVILNKSGRSNEEITLKINKGRNCTGALNSLLWSKNITRNNKKTITLSYIQMHYTDHKGGNKRKI